MYRRGQQFESPIKLHYSQTFVAYCQYDDVFESPIKLHYSQTYFDDEEDWNKFESPIKLHYSQTMVSCTSSTSGLSPL